MKYSGYISQIVVLIVGVCTVFSSYAGCPDVKAYCYSYSVDASSPIPHTRHSVKSGSKWDGSTLTCKPIQHASQFLTQCRNRLPNTLAVVYPAYFDLLQRVHYKVFSDAKLLDDVSHWMGDLSQTPVFGTMSISAILIPGTHDSGTSGINKNSPEGANAPDLPDIVNTLKEMGLDGLIQEIYASWSKTQPYDTKAQLQNGIRYFDIRLCGYDNDIYTCHGKLGTRLDNLLRQVREFIDKPANRKEIIVLDMNHLYDVNHELAYQKIVQYLSDNLASSERFNADSALNDFWQQHKQIILVYANQTFAKKHPLFWAPNRITRAWPDARKINDFIKYISNSIQQRHQAKLYVLESIMTPNDTTVKNGILHRPHDLHQFTYSYLQDLFDWIEEHNSEIIENGNIVLQDWSYGKALTQWAIRINRQKFQPKMYTETFKQ